MLSQTVLVAHDLEHLNSGHNELCAVYVSHDHSADNVDENGSPIFTASAQRIWAELIGLSGAVSSTVYASRAPPILISYS